MWLKVCNLIGDTYLLTFVTNSDKMTTELENPFILLHEKKLTNLQPMVPLIRSQLFKLTDL